MENVFLKKNKRQRIAIASVGCALLLSIVLWVQTYLFSQGIESFGYGILLVLSGIIVWWALDIGSKYRYFMALVILIYLLLTIALVYIIDTHGLLRIFLVCVYGVAIYTLLLVGNILLVSSQQSIPLKRAAISTLYLGGILLVTLYVTHIVHSGWGINFGFLSTLVFISAFVFAYFSFLSEELNWVESMVCIIVVAEIGILINMFPVHPAAAMAAFIGWSFLIIGTIQHHLQKDLKMAIYREYIFIGLLLLFVYFGVG